MWLVVFLFTRIVCGRALDSNEEVKSPNYFNVFGAIPRSGSLQTNVGDTYYGYKFLCDYILSQGGFSIYHLNSTELLDFNGDVIKFAFNCSFEDNKSIKEENIQLIEQQLEKDNVDFYVGSHPEFEPEQGYLVDQNNKLLMQCCVGPEEYYQNENVFGVQVSNSRIAVISNYTRFEKSTCENAEKYANDFELNTTVQYLPKDATHLNSSQIRDFVQNIKSNGIQALLGCVEIQDAINIVKEIDSQKVPLKSIFFTVAPSKAHFIEELGNLSEFILTAGQWHEKINYNDQIYFNNTREYVKLYQNYTSGEKATYTSAGAFAAIEYLMYTIQHAFIGCNISASNGDIKELLYDKSSIDCSKINSEKLSGYELIRLEMGRQKVETFFGEIEFGKNGRNVAMEPATIQVQSKNGKFEGKCVLPVAAASDELIMPQPNPYLESCEAGYYQPEDQFEECQPCQKGTFRNESDSCLACSPEQYNDKVGQQICQECPQYSRTQFFGSTKKEDCVCEIGYFRNPSKEDLECLACPEHGECQGGNASLQPLAGYWMDISDPISVHQCSPKRVCLGGEQSKCLKGYTGKLCAECDESYYSVFGQCKLCPSHQILILQVVGVVIAWWIVNTVMCHQMDTFDIVLSWVQLLSVVGSFDMNWPPTIQRILNLASLFAFEVDIIDLSCIIPGWGFFHNFIVQLSMPILVALLASFSYLISYIVYHTQKSKNRYNCTNFSLNISRKFRFSQFQYMFYLIWKGFKFICQLFIIFPNTERELEKAKNYAIAGSLSFISISYLTLVKYSFDSFKCTEFNGEYVMQSNIELHCDTQEYRNIRILGVICLVVYVIPFPVFCLATLFFLKLGRAFNFKKYLEQFGWLYNRYEVEWYWYEMTQIFHRVLFVLVLVFVDSAPMQVSVAMLVTIGLLMLHVYSQPYIDIILDILHMFLQVTLMLLILPGVIFYYSETDDSDRKVTEIFTLVSLSFVGCIIMSFLFRNIYVILLVIYAKYRVKRKIEGKALQAGGQTSNNVQDNNVDDSDINDGVIELMHTFKIEYLRHWIGKASEQDLRAFYQLSGFLAKHVSNESDTSYLALTKNGRWWRYLTKKFPEIIDFLAVADDSSITNFIRSIRVKQSYFFRNKDGTNICNMIRWQDRGAVAYWLTVSPSRARKAFIQVAESMFLHAKGSKIAHQHKLRVALSGRVVQISEGSQMKEDKITVLKLMKRYIKRKIQIIIDKQDETVGTAGLQMPQKSGLNVSIIQLRENKQRVIERTRELPKDRVQPIIQLRENKQRVIERSRELPKDRVQPLNYSDTNFLPLAAFNSDQLKITFSVADDNTAFNRTSKCLQQYYKQHQ